MRATASVPVFAGGFNPAVARFFWISRAAPPSPRYATRTASSFFTVTAAPGATARYKARAGSVGAAGGGGLAVRSGGGGAGGGGGAPGAVAAPGCPGAVAKPPVRNSAVTRGAGAPAAGP